MPAVHGSGNPKPAPEIVPERHARHDDVAVPPKRPVLRAAGIPSAPGRTGTGDLCLGCAVG